jgi:hypothetical protein
MVISYRVRRERRASPAPSLRSRVGRYRSVDRSAQVCQSAVQRPRALFRIAQAHLKERIVFPMADRVPRFPDRDPELLLGQAAIGTDLREATAESLRSPSHGGCPLGGRTADKFIMADKAN